MIRQQRQAYTDEELYALLHPWVRAWFQRTFQTFSPPQRYALPLIARRENCLVSAPTGSGKCVTPDTLVLVRRGGRAALIEAGQLLRDLKGPPRLRVGKGALYDGGGLEVYALGPDGQGRWTPAHVYVEPYDGLVCEVETQGGRRVVLSPEHPLLVETEKGAVWKPVRSVRAGDRIGVPRWVPLPQRDLKLDAADALQRLRARADVVVTPTDLRRLRQKTRGFREFSSLTPLELRQLLTVLGMSYAKLAQALGVRSTATVHRLLHGGGRPDLRARLERLLRDRLGGVKLRPRELAVQQGNFFYRFRYPGRVDARVAEWVAFVLAEGHIHVERGGAACLTVSQQRHPRLLNRFLRLTEGLFGLPCRRKGAIEYVLSATPVVRFLIDLLGLEAGRSRDVPLPAWLLNAPKTVKARFLRVFFSLEAEVSSKRISLTQASKRKIEQLHYLLLDFGVYSSLRERVKWATNTAAKRRRTYYELEISGVENVARFLAEIGLDHPHVRRLIRGLASCKAAGAHVGTVRFDYTELTALRPFYGSWRAFRARLGTIYEVVRRTGRITPAALRALHRELATLSLSALDKPQVQSLQQRVDALLAQNVLWVKIRRLRWKRYRGPLIDLTVPHYENFVGGSGALYLHNTLTAFLTILSELVTLAERGELENRVYCVYVSPLKALGNDIRRNLQEPLRGIAQIAKKELGIRVAVRTGDTSTYEKQKMLRQAPHILITTPESLAIALTARGFSQHFRGVEWVIVDEVHALAENKRGVHLSLSLERLQELVGHEIARIGLSATIHPLDEIARFLVGRRYGRALVELSDGEDPWRDCLIVDARFDKKLDLQVLSPVDDFIHCSTEELHGNLYELLARLIDEHRTTLIFTNTRSGTERVVHFLKERYPHLSELIGAHHGSLSKELRLSLEERLKRGELKCVVCSTSLELGIDIGYVDLVILLGSPKSVTRALQRVGRSGHKLHDTVVGRIVVTDRDDLVECAVMLKGAVERKLDRIHIPTNCLDVLAQQVFGMVLDRPYAVDDLYEIITRSYCYHTLPREDFERVLEYLAGEYASLEDRRVYAKIYYDREKGVIGKRGRLARVLYVTNVGTIPDESYVTVKMGDKRIGSIEESFLEMLRKGDIFVLGGETYRFKYSRGMTAQVEPARGKTPTVPSWFSEMLPLSFDLALEIQEFREKMARMFEEGRPPEEIKQFIREELYLDERGVESLYRYFAEQHRYAEIPHRHKVLVEYYQEELAPHLWRGPVKTWVIFHTLFGRRVNDALSRALAWLISRREDRDVEIGITDHGFYLAYEGKVRVMSAFDLLKERDLRSVLKDALSDTEILKRRFRHCATRSLMILKNYKGRRKSVGSQQMKAFLLQHAVEAMDERFPILLEAYREVMEDAMDVANAQRVIDEILRGEIEIVGRIMPHPSPFAFHIVMQGRSDLIKYEDRHAFLQRMYRELMEQLEEEGVQTEA